MGSVWIPPDITPICQEARAPLTQCSPTGYMFLSLIAQLFGGSIDLPRNPYSFGTGGGFATGTLTSPLEKSFLGPTQIPLGLTPVKPIGVGESPLGPVVPTEAFREEGRFHSLFKPNSDFKFDFEKPFSKFEQSQRLFDYNYLNPKYFDFEGADSKVSVKTEKVIKKEKIKTRKKRQAVEEYDFIVVGAGSAGCVVANRLSEVKKWKILLLEAGPEEPDITMVPSFAPTLGRSNIDWNYRTQPEELTCRAQRGQTCAWLSGRTMGGSSAINYMVYMRGNKMDYDNWEALGNYGWSYRDVLPFFKKSESNQDFEAQDHYHHGTEGPMNIERFPYADLNVIALLKAFNETGLPIIDTNGRNQIGTMITQTTSKNGFRISANAAFIRPVRNKRSNLVIKTNAQVTKILMDVHTGIAYGVKFVRNGKWHVVFARKEVILSAGALNTPKILMLSGIGPKKELDILNIGVIKDLKVGYNLQNHVTTDAMIIKLTNNTSTLLSGEQLINEVNRYNKYKDGPLSATGATHITAFIRTRYAPKSISVPDIQFHFDGRNLKEFYSDPTNYLAANIFPFSFYDSINVRPILLVPKSKGFITLNRTDAIFGQPLIYSRFFTVKEDLNALVDALKFIITLEETDTFKKYKIEFMKKSVPGCSNFVWGTTDYFACLFTSYTTTIFHPAGTCKMGPHWDEHAVVDPRLNVYGIKRLRVVDNSIMPVIVRGNTMAAAIMIGEKASHMIKEDWHTFN